MARTIRDVNLDTRTARSRLKPRRKPYWRKIDQSCHVGYYKGKGGGSWVARYFLGGGRYAESKIALADDIQDADGVRVLSFTQAQAYARRWFSEQAHKKAGVHNAAPYKVADAIHDYLRWYEVHRRDIANVRYRFESLILPSLGQNDLSKLTPSTIRTWHEALATTRRGRVPPRACHSAIVNPRCRVQAPKARYHKQVANAT